MTSYTQDYREEMDVIKNFMDENYERVPLPADRSRGNLTALAAQGQCIAIGDIYENYRRLSEEPTPMSKKRFSQELQKKGYESLEGNGKKRYYFVRCINMLPETMTVRI